MICSNKHRKLGYLLGALWLLVVGAGCGEPLHVGRILEFEIPPSEWTENDDTWQVMRASDETDGRHTYADFLGVSSDYVLDEVWLERWTIVSVDGSPEDATLKVAAVLPTGEQVELADGPFSVGELHLSDTSGSLLDASSSFGTPSLEFRFEVASSTPPTGSIRLDANFNSSATRRGL